jgi:hypothetical protein
MAGKLELIPQDKFDAICLAVPSPMLSQEHIDNLTATVPLLTPMTMGDAIMVMEEALAASQGGPSPALTIIPQELWNVLHEVMHSLASRLPDALAHSSSFSQVRNPTPSCGSSPMDLSPPSPGWLAAPAPPIFPLGEHPEAPIELSSDKSSVLQILELPSSRAPATGGQGNMGEVHVQHISSSPLLGVSSLEDVPSGESSYSSSQDAAHAISLSLDNSSFHSHVLGL